MDDHPAPTGPHPAVPHPAVPHPDPEPAAADRPLRLGDGFGLPLDAVTTSIAFLGITGSGKTYAASVLVEEMLSVGVPVIVLDVQSAFWGLRWQPDGCTPSGFDIVVHGGDHADRPLDLDAIPDTVAEIVDGQRSAIFDLSDLRRAQCRAAVAEILEELYARNRTPRGLFVDEADVFAPQQASAATRRTAEALEDVVRRGRKFGIGTTLICQRSAILSKDVLSQVKMLVAMQCDHNTDVDAIGRWVGTHADQRTRTRMLTDLPALPTGTAWVWSPGWLDTHRRVEIRERHTYDSSATPTVTALTLPTPSSPAVETTAAALTADLPPTIELAVPAEPAPTVSGRARMRVVPAPALSATASRIARTLEFNAPHDRSLLELSRATGLPLAQVIAAVDELVAAGRARCRAGLAAAV